MILCMLTCRACIMITKWIDINNCIPVKCELIFFLVGVFGKRSAGFFSTKNSAEKSKSYCNEILLC